LAINNHHNYHEINVSPQISWKVQNLTCDYPDKKIIYDLLRHIIWFKKHVWNMWKNAGCVSDYL